MEVGEEEWRWKLGVLMEERGKKRTGDEGKEWEEGGSCRSLKRKKKKIM